MSSKDWGRFRLGDITEWKSGGTPSKVISSYWDGDIPWISAKTLTSNTVYSSPTKISKAGLMAGSRLASVNSILLLVRGSGLFNGIPAAIVKRNVAYNQDIKEIVPNSKYIVPEYLLYWIEANHKLLRDKLEETGIGAGKFDTDILKNLEIQIPNYSTQIKVVNFIKGLDDKIELNQQTNKTLEAIVEALFKEWFVDFNFPGATGEMVESELGMIPKGWRVDILGSIYRTTSGGTPSRAKMKFYENGTIPWIKSKELNNSFITKVEESITDEALQRSSAKLLPKHTALIAMYGATVGEIGITGMEAACNQAICAFIPNEQYPYTFIYHFLKTHKADIALRAVGSAQQNISQDLLKRIKLIVPSTDVLQLFHVVVNSLLMKVERNFKESECLCKLKDSLISRLMNRELML